MEMVVVLRRRVSVRCMGVMRLFVRPVFMVGWHRRLVVRRDFEARRLPWQLDADDLPGVLQTLDLPVDGRQVQAGHGGLRLFQQVLRAQRLTAACERIDDGLALARVAFHDDMLMQLHWH